MLITERLTINGKEFIRTFSDSGFLIERDGVLYSEAIDPVDSGRTYTETGKTYEDSVIEEDVADG